MILALFISPAITAGPPTWIMMQNENFRVYSSAGERPTRNAFNQFERVRRFFIQSTGFRAQKSTPITVVIFGTEQEYEPYRANGFADAYYTQVSGRDFIVVGELNNQSSQIATHEYTHLVLRDAGFSLPPWLNEGLAELFSTLRTSGDFTEFGDVLPGRLQALNRDPWVPMATILAADEHSPYYNEASQAGSLYNQSWALVHMLTTTEKYRSGFWNVVTAINSGTPSVQALEKAYAMPFPDLETALKFYIRYDDFYKLKQKIKLESAESLTATPADMFDVREAQAELLMGFHGKRAEARNRFEELARENVKRPEPWASLGYLALHDGKTAEATDNFGKAFDLGNRSPRLLMDYAQLAEQEKPERSAAAFSMLLELQPKNLDARLELANLQLREGQYAEALATGRSITAVKSVEQRDDLLYLRAYASMRLGDMAEARARAEELKRLTASEDLRLRADEVLQLTSAP